MKYGFAFILLLLPIFMFGETEERTKLEQLLFLFESNNIQLEEWKLYTRGRANVYHSESDFEKAIERLTAEMDSFVWKKDPNEYYYLSGMYTHPTLPLEETLSIYSYPSRQHSYLMFVSYEMVAKPSGEKFDIAEHEQRWNKTLETVFPKNKPTVYTIVKGKEKNNGKLYERAEQLASQLGAEKVEELKEERFVSLAAYNKQWKDELVSRDQKINLQIGLRQEPNLGLHTTVTIGTPIITTEY